MIGLVEFFRERLGMDLWPGQVEVLGDWETSGKPNALFCLGRRSGKNTLMAGAAIFNAIQDYEIYKLPRGWPRYIIVVANSLGQATEFITQVRVLLANAQDPDLLALVDTERCTRTKIQFRHDVAIEALACSEKSIRGRAVSMAIFDEAGMFNSDDEGSGAGKELYRAMEPALAQFGADSHIIFISTPYHRFGLFWEQYRNGTELDNGQPIDTSLFVVRRPTWEMNPDMPRDHPKIALAYRVDPDGAAREYGADFASAAGAFLDPVDVLACQRSTDILPPERGIKYVCAIDPAFQRDAFAVAIAHRKADVVIVDGVWAWTRRGEGAFETSLDELAALCARYSVREVRTDQFSGQAVMDGLAKRHISCDVVAWDNKGKYEAYTSLKALLTTRQISLPNDPQIAQELMGLEAKPTITGLIRIMASAGNHDDRASVLAALADMLSGTELVLAIDRTQWNVSAPENIWDWGDGAFLPD